MEKLINDLLTKIGEDPSREGLVKTPHRVAKSFEYLTSGYKQDINTILNGAIFNETCDEMVVVKKIEFFSLCEHHLLPFYGVCHVAYIPDNKIVGLSKIPRIVEMFARRLQVQERFTNQVASIVEEVLQPKGVGVIASAKHLCMMMRGVEKHNTVVTTSSMKGIFKSDQRTRAEFLSIVNQSDLSL